MKSFNVYVLIVFAPKILDGATSIIKVSLKLIEIETLINAAANLQSISERYTSTLFKERPVNPTIVGRESVLERAWEHLNDDGVGIVGLYCIGAGSGKTTLLTQINNKLTSLSYHYVLWVNVSQASNLRKMMDDIGNKLGLSGEEWHLRNDRENSIQIYNRLKTKIFVQLLDDIWKKSI